MRWGYAAAVLHSRRPQTASRQRQHQHPSAAELQLQVNLPDPACLFSFFLALACPIAVGRRVTPNQRCIPQRALPPPPHRSAHPNPHGSDRKVGFLDLLGPEKPWPGRWTVEVDAVGSISLCTSILSGHALALYAYLSR
jgi:hypothetical protein